MSQIDSTSRFSSINERMPQQQSQVRLELTLQGVYSFPEEWKSLDETNPNIFTYQVRLYDGELVGGKIVPRELTAKEKREQEEALAAKTKKAPPGKKDAAQLLKEQQEEEESQRRRQEEDELEAQKQKELDALDPEMRFYKISEDRYKSPQILFEKNTIQIDRTATDLVIFEERVNYDCGEFILFVRQPSLSEDDIIKLRKAKPKTLPNLNELIPIVMRGWIDLSKLKEPGTTEFIQRVKLELHIDETTLTETPKPNIENTYIFLKLSLNQPIYPLRKDVKPTFKDIIPLAPGVPPLHPSQLCIKELRGELELIIESLAMEYSNMFGRELNLHVESKSKNMMLMAKKQDLQKRKEHFLYDFNISGKYKILKERIKKSIVKICRDKFGKSGSITGITTGQQDQFYSELYVFLMDEMRKVIIQLVREKKEALVEDHLLTKEFAQKRIDDLIVNCTRESKSDQLSRLAEEYESLNKVHQADKHYLQLLELNSSDHNSLYQFALFSLRIGNFLQAEKYLEKALSYNNDNTEYQKLLATIYIRKGSLKDAYTILLLILESDPQNLLINLLKYFTTMKLYPQDQQKINKSLSTCQRILQRSLDLINSIGNHKQKPMIYDLPWVKIPIPLPEKPEKGALEKIELQKQQIEALHHAPQLTKDQLDQMYLKLLSYFDKFYLYDLIEKSISFVNNQDLLTLYKAKVQAYKKNVPEAILIMNIFLQQNPRDYDVLLAKGNLQYQQGMYSDCEETFLKALKLPEGKTTFTLYLRLGYLYLKNRQFGNARAFLTKASEIKPQSSLAWLGLGIACYQSKLWRDAETALNQANIFEPANPEVWAYIALNALDSQENFIVANQAIRELKKIEFDPEELLSEILAYSGEFSVRKGIYEYLDEKLQRAAKQLKILEA